MKKFFILLFCIISTQGFSQNITIDLSQNVNTVFTQSISPQTISSLILANKSISPSASYNISIVTKHQAATVLSIPTAGAGAGAPPPAPCLTLANDVSNLEAETDESKIPGEIKTIRNDIQAAGTAACASYVAAANAAIAATTEPRAVIPIVIKGGDELDITITEGNKVWTYKYVTEQINHVIVYYGFTYVPDLLTSFPNYYTQQQSDGTYMISRMHGNNKNIFQNISPTVMFTYRFFDTEDQSFKLGLTGGFTYNTQSLGALFGPSLVIGDVITLNTGLTAIQKYTLLGQYTESQIIKDNLSFNQLHNQIWTFDVFFSIGLNIPQLFNKSSTKPATATATN